MTQYEKILIALDIWREGSNQTEQAWNGIMHVILNRVNHPRWWGHDIVSVITHRWQFSSMTAIGDPNLIRWPQTNDPQFLGIINMIEDFDKLPILEKGSNDPTHGSIFYFSPPLTEPPTAWGKAKFTIKIGILSFYAEG